MATRPARSIVGSLPALAMMSSVAVAQDIVLEGIVVTSTKTSESVYDTLSGSSARDRRELDEQFQPDRISEVLRTIPGVGTQETARDTATAINIRGLQDFGRVNVLVEGARQNFQRSGHAANGVFYIEPEMVKGIDITRGPTATIYGSGAIGGVAYFELLDADDILRPGEHVAGRLRTAYETNGEGRLTSGTAAARIGNFDILGQINGRWNEDYEDGDGHQIPGSNDETRSALVKSRWRPAAGHEITVTALDFNSEFTDQVEEDGTLYDTSVDNRQYTLGYTFTSPTNPLIDFSAKIYRNETRLAQTRLTGGDSTFFSNVPGPGGFPCPFPTIGPCFMFPGVFPVGATRSFDVKTHGFDVFNTSRLNLNGVKVALTYGGDGFRDSVNTSDPTGSGDEFTPSGERRVHGGFFQSHLTFFDVIDLIGAVRYDSYELDGGGTHLSDDRVSPKVTLGVTPIKGVTLFGTYAEGFRAPALSETLISGFHPGFAHFRMIPNPELRPEVAHNVEGGVNLKFDGVLTPGDRLRAKLTAFQNKVDDYIDQVFIEGPVAGIVVPPSSFIPVFTDDTFQYRNVRNATLEGIEFEAFYDARAWFVGVGAHRIRGTNDDTGEGLFSVPADQITITVGMRMLQERLLAGARTRIVGEQDRFVEAGTASHQHAEAYTLLDLFAQYEVNDNATLNLNIDNVFNETYRQHMDQNNSPGLSARLALTMRLGTR
ncbi:MAG TPA: TonB-dependent hemoglobin/transferrin/lactoferrin family receptor [Hyphomicrobiaceae bacterium]|nr:TonB-dependent hemoglobin/transferrin/lactoferrin family receptor [Hyphomicrobiaceae bacterium]